MIQPWFDADMKIYTPRVRTIYEGTEDLAGACAASDEQESLSLWNPAKMHTQPIPQSVQENQPYIEP